MPPPAAPTSTKEQVGAALQTAGQYAGGSTVWTPQNAEELGLDPSRGYIAKGTPTDQPQPTLEQLRQDLQQSGALPKPITPTTHPGLRGFTGAEQAAPPRQSQQPGPVPSPLPEPPVSEPPVSVPTSVESDLKGAISEEEHAKEEKKGKAATSQLEGAVSEEEHAKEGKSPPQLEGAVSEEEHAKEAAAPPISEKPAPAPTPAPQPATPMPSGTGAGAPQGEPADPHAQVQALIASGKTPGEAQAIVAGQEPTTVTGEKPPPKPEPAPKTEQPQPQGETIDWGKLGYKSFEDYQKFINTLGLHTAVRGPGTTATLVEKGQADQPNAATSTVPTEPGTTTGGKTINGTSTIFALNYDGSLDQQDNGQGFFTDAKGQPIDTRKAIGGAVPWDILESIYGVFTKSDGKGGRVALDTPEAKAIIAKIQSSHLEVPDDKGNIHKFPIVDIQGSIAGHPGKVLDLTWGATKELGFTDNHHVSYQIVGGDGKPYPVPDISTLPAYAGKRKGDYVPTPGGLAGPWISVGGEPSGGGAAPEQFRAPSEGGGGGAQPDYSPSESRAEPISLAGVGGLLAGAAAGFASRGQPQAAQPSEEKGPSPSDVVAKVLAAGGPPPAPGAAPVDLSTMKQANVLSVKPIGAPQLGLPAPPAAPSTAPTAPDPIVIKGLMKRGFTRAQAEAFAAKATVSKPGATALAGGASFRKPAQLAAPPPAPSRQPSAVAKPQAQVTPAKAWPQTTQGPVITLGGVTRPGAKPAGSTVGVARPAGSEALEGVPLAQAVKQHAALLSPDDPRVKKQADGMFKGEHFVPGDPVHDPALAGLPGGHGGRQRQLLGEAEQAIAEKRPLHISYISAPQEAEKFPTRESRKIQYDEHSPEARLMGTTEGQLVGHSMIPVSVGVKLPKKAGEPHQSYIQGVSTNVIANNFAHLNTKLAAMGLKTPYARFGPKFANDLEGYLHNLNAGHTGTGRGYALGTAEYPNEPDTSHVPYKLTRHEADFLNTVINNTGAFAKHEDAKALRELARINGTLITPEGETNRMRHQIEQHEPGWRSRVLEPSIRSFKTGLIHDIHPSEEHMPATIRPGQDYRSVTEAMQRTSERGRPDVPVSVSLHHTFADNKAINQIERDFSEERINEAQARERLHALGEDPEQYRFVGGSGGLITPYEENPEAITPEEHTQLKDNLRKQWIGGKLGIEDYRRKAAEVPLPEKPSLVSSGTSATTPEPEESEAPEETRASQPRLSKPVSKGEGQTINVGGHDLPRNSDGTVSLYHATKSHENAERIVKEKTLRSAGEPSVYLSTAPSGTGYGEHVVSVNVHPKHLQLDDEFPNGRADFRIDKKVAPVSAASHHQAPVEPTAAQKEAPATPPPAPSEPESPQTPDGEMEARGEPPAPATAPAPGDVLPPAKAKKPAKTKEEKAAEAEDLRQAALDRNDIPDKDTKQLNRLQRVAKGWIKQNPELHPLSAHTYLTGQKEFPNQGELNKADIGEHFDADNPKLDLAKEEHREHAAGGIVHDIMHALAGTKTGKPSTAYGWYDRAVRKTLAKISQIAPKILSDPEHGLAFKLGTAITSQGQDVFPNAVSGYHVYRHWLKNGKLPTDAKVFGGGPKADAMVQNFTKVNALWKKLGTDGLQKLLTTKMTVRDLKDKYGLEIDEPLDTKVYGAMALGPKIGAFFSNLHGNFDPTTIDMWFSRTMNRLGGNMFGFSDKAMRQDRMEKGKVVKSHLSELGDLLNSGQLTGVDKGREQKMQAELAALKAHPQGQLDRAKALELAPEIHNWAKERTKIYARSEGYERSYHPDLKTPENVVAKKLHEGANELSDAPRTTSERRHWHDIMERVDTQLRDAGVKLTNADKQALLWFVEKDLFRQAGSNSKVNADYLDAAYRLVRKVKSGELPGLEGGTGVLHMQGGGLVPDPAQFSLSSGTQVHPPLTMPPAPPAPSLAPKAQPVVPRARPVQTPAVTTGPATLLTGSSSANSASQLGDLRAPIAQEFQANPDARQKLINSVYREVQDQPQAWLPYIESAMNRSVARNKSLVYTIDPTLPKPKRYFPYDAWPEQAPEAFAKKVNPLIDQALQGSNMAGYATGNESKDVHSKNTPIAFNPGTGERFIVEEPDLGWASQLSPIPIFSTRGEKEE